MPADLSGLNARLDALRTQVAATETTDASAIALLNGFAGAIKQAVADAITADDAIDNSAIGVVNTAIDEVTARFTAADAGLGAAVVANTPPATASRR